MKKYFLGLSCFFTVTMYAQNTSCNEKANTMLISKIKKYPSDQLIPYYSEKNDRWGIFDRKTKKILTEPVLRDAAFFHPHINLYYGLETNGQENGCNGKIMGSEENYRIADIQNSGYIIYEASGAMPNMPKRSNKDKVKDEISGFEVDAYGNLVAFNPKYYNAEKDEPTIYNIVPFKNLYFAIVKNRINNETFFSIINQKGETFSGFEKLSNYPHHKQIYSHEKDVWFLIETNKNHYILKSLFKGTPFKDNFVNTDNWQNFAQTIGYAIMQTKEGKGILDLTNLEWKIKPAKNNDFWYLNYASLKPLAINYDKDEYSYNSKITIPIEMIKKNRKNTYIYIQNSKYSFYDLNMKLYQPKNN